MTVKIMKALHMTITIRLCRMKKTVVDLIMNMNLILLMMSMDLVILNMIMILTTRMRDLVILNIIVILTTRMGDHAMTKTDLVTVHLVILVERGVVCDDPHGKVN